MLYPHGSKRWSCKAAFGSTLFIPDRDDTSSPVWICRVTPRQGKTRLNPRIKRLLAGLFTREGRRCLHDDRKISTKPKTTTIAATRRATTHFVRLVEVLSHLRLQVVHHHVQGPVGSRIGGLLAVVSHIRVPVVAVQRPVHVGRAREHPLKEIHLFRERGVRVDLPVRVRTKRISVVKRDGTITEAREGCE